MSEKGKNVLLSVAAAFICAFVYHVIGRAVYGVIADDYLSPFLAEILFAVLAAGTVILLGKTDLYRSDPAYLKSGWTSAGLFFVQFAVLGFFGLARLIANGAHITVMQWLLVIGHVILIGFSEEVLFRGLIQRSFHRLFGEDSFAHVLLAVICSGLVFGCAHLINMDRGNPALAAVLQAGVTVFIGMYLGAIYYRTGKNIWYVLFLHGFYDFLGMIMNGRANGSTLNSVLSPNSEALTAQGVALNVLVWGSVYFGVTLLVLRPKKLKPLLSGGKDGTERAEVRSDVCDL